MGNRRSQRRYQGIKESKIQPDTTTTNSYFRNS